MSTRANCRIDCPCEHCNRRFAQVWPKSESQRENDAVDTCRAAADDRGSTFRAKRWNAPTVTVADGGGYRVEDKYITQTQLGPVETGTIVCNVDSQGKIAGFQFTSS